VPQVSLKLRDLGFEVRGLPPMSRNIGETWGTPGVGVRKVKTSIGYFLLRHWCRPCL